MLMKIEDTLECIIDNRGKTPPTVEEGRNLLEINCISNNGKFPDYSVVKKHVSEETYASWFRTGHPKRGDVLIPTVGTLDAIGFMDRDDCCIAQNLIAFRTKKNVCNGEYLFYLLCNPIIRKRLLNLDIGGVQPSIKVPHLKKLEVEIPTIDVQNKVISILHSIDEKISCNEQINRNLSEQLRIIFEDMFITNADDSWPEKKLGDFLELERGLSYKGKFLAEDEGVPMLNLGNILPNSVFRPEKLKYYTGEYKARHVVKPGDIIVANTDLTQAREVLGSAIRVPDLRYESVICSHHISIVRNSKISNNFILGLLNMPAYRTRVAGFATGTTVLALPNDTILNCEFLYPTEELLAKYDDIAEPIYGKMEGLRLENDQLTLIRDSLLPKLMSGELDISKLSI